MDTAPTPAPDWLAPAYPITPDDVKRLGPFKRSWSTLSAGLATLSENDLLKLIVLEYRGERRPIIIGRCWARFRRHRHARETRELFAHLASKP